jgi:hypothetical protein
MIASSQMDIIGDLHVRHEGSPVAIFNRDAGFVSTTITSTDKECLCQTKQFGLREHGRELDAPPQ